jgi:hypothetical protein
MEFHPAQALEDLKSLVDLLTAATGAGAEGKMYIFVCNWITEISGISGTERVTDRKIVLKLT